MPRRYDDNDHLLRRTNRRDVFQIALERTRMPMVITDPTLDDNPIVFANAAFESVSGYPQHEIVGRNCRFLQGPETDADAVRLVRARLAERAPVLVQLVNYRKDGRRFWNQLFVSPIFDEDGTLRHFFGSQLDVTEPMRLVDALRRSHAELERRVAQRTQALREMVEQRDALLREIGHRAKNNLQMIASLVEIQAGRAEGDAARAFDDLRARIDTLATFHEIHDGGEARGRADLGAYLRRIAENVTAVRASTADVRLIVEAAPHRTDIDRAVPIGLIVNELLTNGYKHAFPDGRAGTIRVALARLGGQRLRLTVADDGVGCPIKQLTDGQGSLGWSIVTALAQQVEGEIAVDTERGCRFTLDWREPADDAGT